MEERKHIDRLYQEKFKDFEATPREVVWKNISSRLKEKERRRSPAPFWYKLAGVAAVLALFLNYATNLLKNNTTSPTVATEVDRDFGKLNLVSTNYKQNMFRSSLILQAIMQDTKMQEERTQFAEQIAVSEAETTTISNSVISSGVAGAIDLTEKRPYTFADYNDPSADSGVSAEEKEEFQSALKSLPLPGEEKKPLEEEIATKSENSKKIRVSTTAAPIYYDNFGRGNSIDAKFASNESGGEVTMSYGINFAYQLSEKLKVRSGISKVNMSHNTRNIAFTAAVNPVALSGINYGRDIPNYRIENRSVRPFSNLNASTEFDRASLAAPAPGFLNQRIGFIEVPLEIEYSIIDKKIGVNLIGGGSTLFLDENMISLNSSNFSTDLGQANNLNQVSFSTNIGVGLDYEISPQFQLNLEPIFKYQINTYNGSNDGINPYYFGIYSGFSFKF